MANKVSIVYYGMDGWGRNVTEAKRDAGARIERALTGSYTPEVYSHRGMAYLVYRTPDGWHAAIIADETGIRPNGVYGVCGCNYGDKAEAVRRALYNLAQLTWTHDDDDEAPEFVKDRSDRSDFRGWVRFQRRCKIARERGMNDADIHAYACENPMRPELWVHERAAAV